MAPSGGMMAPSSYPSAGMMVPSYPSARFAPSSGATSTMTDMGPEYILTQMGYTPKKRLIKNVDGAQMVAYIVTINPHGQHVLVHNDTHTITAIKPDDLTVIYTTPVTIIPLSVKQGMMTGLDMGVAGNAVECKEGLCILTRDGSGITETTLTLEKKHADVTAMIGDHGPIPVISMRELIANPEAVLRATDATTRQNQVKMNETSRARLAEMSARIKNMDAAYNNYIAARNEYASALANSTAQSNAYYTSNANAIKTHPANAANYTAKMEEARSNVIIRGGKARELSRFDDSVTDERSTVERLTEKFNVDADRLRADAKTLPLNLAGGMTPASAGVGLTAARATMYSIPTAPARA